MTMIIGISKKSKEHYRRTVPLYEYSKYCNKRRNGVDCSNTRQICFYMHQGLRASLLSGVPFRLKR